MKEYHFSKNNQNLDETIRLDDINEKVKQLKQAETEDELGDANAFLDAFESEKFDTLAEDTEEEAVLPEEEPLAEEEDFDDADEEEDGAIGEGEADGPFGLSKKTVTLLALLGVIACILGFSLVRCSFHPSKTPALSAADGVPMLVENVLDAEELLVYDIAEEERKTLFLSEETEILDEDGRSVAYSSVKVGDLFFAEVDKDGETAVTIDYSAAGIETMEATGFTVDTKRHTLTNTEDTYAYSKKAVFLYDGEEITPKELEPCDLLELKMIEDTVWSVEVLESHGYILVENAKEIKNGTIQLDEEDALPLEQAKRIPAREGTHKVTVTGDTIETREDTVLVTAGEEFIYDLSKAQEKVGVIIVNADVSNYKLYINGALAESPAVLPMGEYDLVILKNGYKEWNQHVTLDQSSLTVNAELTRDMQYGTLTVTADTDGAWVYINGEEYGVAPMQVNLPYGSYNVQVTKDGYDTFRQSVTIQSSAASLYATLE